MAFRQALYLIYRYSERVSLVVLLHKSVEDMISFEVARGMVNLDLQERVVIEITIKLDSAGC